MKILLVQHGDAVPEEVDRDRPLSEKGYTEVERVAAFMSRGEIRVSRIVHSGKTRARQTAEILAIGLRCNHRIETVSGLNPNNSVDEWVKETADWSDDTLVVGHMPFMSKFVSRLVTGEESAAVVEFRPGSVVCLQRSEPSGWQLSWMIRPEILAD